jgi:signal transduction histidine kinase
MKTLGLRSEILFTLMFLLIAALLLFGTLYLRFIERELIQQKIAHLRTVSGFLEKTARSGSGLSGQDNMDGLEAFCQTSGCDGWAYYNSSLKVVAASVSGESLSVPVSLKKRVMLTNEMRIEVHFPSWLLYFSRPVQDQLFLAVPLKVSGRSTGVFEAIYPLADIRSALLASVETFILYIVGMIFVLIGVGYYVMQKNVISPIRKMLIATKGVAEGNLSDRLKSEGPREICELTTEFNSMAAALEKNKQDTHDHIKALSEANHELKEARHEIVVSEKMASVGQLAAGFAHEIGNPLSALIGYLELLKIQIPAETQNGDILQRALLESGRIDALVCDILDYARPKDRSLKKELSLVEEIRFCVELLKNQGRLKSLKVVECFAERLPLVLQNRTNVQQVIMNLLLNAVDACREGGIITISGDSDVNTVSIIIRDTGEGIRPEDLAKIFDPFFTTKAPGSGTGLGLSVCHRIVESFGGHIEIDSIYGEGSEFRVFFPL